MVASRKGSRKSGNPCHTGFSGAHSFPVPGRSTIAMRFLAMPFGESACPDALAAHLVGQGLVLRWEGGRVQGGVVYVRVISVNEVTSLVFGAHRFDLRTNTFRCDC